MTACLKCGHDPAARILASWMLFLEADPSSLNSHVVNAGATRFAYKKERTKWAWLIRAARLAKRIPFASGKRRITLTRHYDGRQQERDRDNLSGGMKCIVDAFVLERLLVDDDAAHAEIHYQQVRTSPRGLVVLIEELADAG